MSPPSPGPAARTRAVAGRARTLLAEGAALGAWPLPAGEDPRSWCEAATGALQRLEAGGHLDRPDGFRGTLGDALDRLARGPLAPTLADQPGRRRLLGELIRNLDQPDRIGQGHKGSCAAACLERHLAERDPGEYARLVAGLCTPSGAVGLRDGQALLRDEPTLGWTEAEGLRGPVSALFQVALLEAANPAWDYRNAEDAQFDPALAGGEGRVGLGLGEFDALLEAVTGQQWATLTDRHDDLARLLGLDPATLPALERDGEGIVRRALAAGDAVFATLAAPGGGATPPSGHPHLALPHKVRLVHLDSVTDVLTCDDPLAPERPWIPGARCGGPEPAGRCRVPLATLLGLVVELSFPPRHGPSAR